ncbi:MAG TPA: sulfur carrier protein ThiS [Solirubrobacteraceae bacterium]|nr:sulfur carrier protein ThiS [Solirubrobacteraceae bacterium]
MIYVNGKPVQADGNPTIRDVLLAVEIDPDRGGIAVAVDSQVARRAVWPTQTLEQGAHVEIVTATQGG